MLFSSPIFLFLFLPIVLLFYFSIGRKFPNMVLIIASLVFYFWGEPKFIYFLLIVMLINWYLALMIQRYNYQKASAKLYLFFSLILNLGFLIYYKYWFFLLHNFFLLFGKDQPLIISNIVPLAISFFTFHAISYQVDIYRGRSTAQKNPIRLAPYFLMFPHLLAGPILRYHQIEKQLYTRIVAWENLGIGIKRFSFGLAKKLLIADRLGNTVNEIFAIPAQNIDFSTAWLGLLSFTLQIYFDFSAYSDMAIGLAKMFGFDFPENFNYPYISSSIGEFWGRWHMTLSNWFRDYLYIPLGGNRKGSFRTYINLIAVFLLVGLWHGANWNFVIWGAIHGSFLVLERIQNGWFVNSLWRPLRHVYTLFVVMISWVFFRTETFNQGLIYLKTLFGFGVETMKYRSLQYFLTGDLTLTILFAIILSFGLYPILGRFIESFTKKITKLRSISVAVLSGFEITYFILLLFLSFMIIAAHTYKSFIYFRF